MFSRNFYILGLLLFSSYIHSSRAFQKTVEIDLVSKWPTPLIAEISEYFAKKGNNNFWTFVESLDGDLSDQDDKASYDEVITRASKLLSSPDLSFLKLSTSIRYFSPLVFTTLNIGKSKVPKDCDWFVEVGGVISCDLDKLPYLIQSYTPKETLVLPKDHQYPANHNKEGKYAVLYSRIGTPVFMQFHTVLKQLSIDGAVNYVFRHYQREVKEKTSLSGYGVELAIKNTEYKAQDDSKIETGEDLLEKDKMDIHGFNFSTLKSIHPSSSPDLDSLRSHLLEASNQMTPLKVWQLQDLSLQAGQIIISEESTNQLALLRDLSQNFPSRARKLVKVQVKEDFKKAIKENQMMLEDSLGVQAGDDYLLINGLKVSIDLLDMFSLVEQLQTEHKLVSDIAAISAKYQVSTLNKLIYFEDTQSSSSTEFGLDTRTQNILYINNLETDKQYQSWPSSVKDLLRPTFPGMLRHLSKNLFNLVFFFDPLDSKSYETFAMVESFYVHSVPVRIGFVFVVGEDNQPNKQSDDQADTPQDTQKDRHREELTFLIAESFCQVHKQNGISQAFAFFKKIRKAEEVTESMVVNALSTHLTDSTITTIVNHKSNCYDTQESTQKYKNSGLASTPKVLINGIPMADEDMYNDFEESIIKLIFTQTSELQKDVYNSKLTDSMDMTEHLMSKPNINTRLNTHIFNSPLKYLQFDHVHDGESFDGFISGLVPFDISHFYSIPNELYTESIAANLHYLSKNEEQDYQLITWWLVADLETPQGRALYSNALKHLKQSKKIRIALIHNQASNQHSRARLSLAVETALHTLPHNVAKNFLNKILKEDNAMRIINGQASLKDFSVGNMDVEALMSQMDKYSSVLQVHALFCRQVLLFEASQKALISNGKIYGPFDIDTSFIEQDFDLLDKLSSNSFTETIEKHMKIIKNISGNLKSSLCMRLESIFLSTEKKESRKRITFTQANLSTIHITPTSPQQASLNIIAILNPASKAAQKIVPVIMVLNELFNTDVTIFFNCQEKLSEMPLKSYYRWVLEAEVMFKDNSPDPVTALFTDLPTHHLLTLNMHTPDSWLVESIYSPYDLDNILLSEAETNIYAQYELDKILLEGHCYDLISGNPPRGLQFTLGTASSHQLEDTIVMANLGYFQLKASPGLWQLNLREGKSNELYQIASVDDKTSETRDVLITMDSFKGKILQVKVNKKKGREYEDLLADDEDESMGIWSSISNTLGGGGSAKSSGDETINVFSLASGHLYERFLRVMMLSVLKNTKSPVKFWFLKNFLSPSFKDFIPHMATKYNFQYELVQYKWPRWLHQQSEKQRMIWGYKILFLDVLFPLNVSKIIFVDADQTVRADLKELNDLDLEGAPYGYTPFCDSRKEMDGYRFWRSGYWASHLGHRKYHISALYVVDLKKFRKIAAGDRLRGQYQGLSQDPNSLSNLDQDLPNNMIHQVAIKSLPQEWLWCETWCSNVEKAAAKTIDLCNNPKTKEPKLDAAMRIVSEWKGNDAEIKQLMDVVSKRKSAKKEAGVKEEEEKKKEDGKEEVKKEDEEESSKKKQKEKDRKEESHIEL